MTTPRLEIDLDKIRNNARTLVGRLADRGISVRGITKATLGSSEIAQAMLEAGVAGLGDSRIENVESMRLAGVATSLTLVRSPMLSQTTRVVASADESLNTEIDVLQSLSRAAERASRSHGVVLMVELGDLREGVMPCDLISMVRQTLHLPHLVFKGIGANLACRSGVTPDDRNMAELSKIVDSIEARLGVPVETVSGGNSANLLWALSCEHTGRINELRLGESILLGREPLHRRPIAGLHTDAIRLVAEVIESKRKPSKPWGDLAQPASGPTPIVCDRGRIAQSLLAIGRQDVDTEGLASPMGVSILSACSDHLVVESPLGLLPIGEELVFWPNYSALVRTMTSPFITKVFNSPISSGRPRGLAAQDGALAIGRSESLASSRLARQK